MRPWYSYNQDPLGSARPTRTTYSPYRNRNLLNQYGYSDTYTLPSYRATETPYVNPNEIIDQVTRQFNQQPVSYSTDPVTGKVIATRSMAKPELPSEMAGSGRLRNMFTSGANRPNYSDPMRQNMANRNVSGTDRIRSMFGYKPPAPEMLTSKFVLPKDALTGDKFIQRNIPTTDASRQGAYGMGVSNIGQNRATLNPQTFWPSSAFNVPMRGAAGGKWTSPTPEFGSTTDYTTGALHTKPIPFSYSNPYSRFDASRKTAPMLPRSQYIPSRLGTRKKKKEKRPHINETFDSAMRRIRPGVWQKRKRGEKISAAEII